MGEKTLGLDSRSKSSIGSEFRKIFAVGDIHGCSRNLKMMLEVLPFDADTDLLVFLGDYVNRGPESKEVIDLLLQLSQKVSNIVFLMGNHEHALLQYAANGDPDNLRMMRPMGIEATLKSYRDAPVGKLRDLSFLSASHRAFLDNLLLFYRAGGYLFTHAGIFPGEDVETSTPDRLLSVRRPFLEYGGMLEEVVVFGHTPFLTPYVTRDRIGIDTGAVFGNYLTAVELPAVRFYHC